MTLFLKNSNTASWRCKMSFPPKYTLYLTRTCVQKCQCFLSKQLEAFYRFHPYNFLSVKENVLHSALQFSIFFSEAEILWILSIFCTSTRIKRKSLNFLLNQNFDSRIFVSTVSKICSGRGRRRGRRSGNGRGTSGRWTPGRSCRRRRKY
jgi:hypothetical protein